ncbi:potassium transporter Kup [Bartonella sp. M0280]|uniref:potassium transporter Kup n=1 Tax=Bartonella apihabitans TaxID=2750929 RepID=UPI0018DC6106|nr:potassium transporter Kup [Bartonella apihabitans]MBI0166715.1 potassium transporter Kup [Bartonella apihabitans]
MAEPQDIDAVSDDLTTADENNDHSKESFLLLLIGAIGVVYGDIGTSPIYAFREALRAGAGNHDILKYDVYGVISLIFWALLLIVTIKYVVFVLHADNNGEGGILSLMALARSTFRRKGGWALGIGILGASLFFGDAVITPAVSVLSAVEGMEVVAPDLEPFIVPLTLIILVALFAVQRFGTGKVAIVFGPITLVWFLALGGFGLFHIFDDLTILKSLFPWYAFSYIVSNPATSFAAVGAVFLAVTGAEALYADLGHFGRRPIVAAWLWIVFPCLVLNYLGQGAFILSHGRNTINPFYQMLPEWSLIPMIVLATMATVIASQAVITGAFSMARQAVQLNILPRLEILHTSEKNLGQIYMPRVNLLLAVIVICLVIGFEKSSNLAAAYGISVTGNMIVTTSLLFIVMKRIWKWSLALCLVPTLAFLCLDLLFFSANLIKIHDGGWVSVGLAFSVVLVMWTWVRGSRHLFKKTRKAEVPLDLIVNKMAEKPPIIVPGTAVFLTSDPKSAPSALMHSLKHYKVLHENNVILTVNTASTPRVPSVDRARVSQFNERFMQVTLTFGYMEQPNIPKALAICRKLGWKFDIMTTSFFVSRRSIKPAAKSDMPMWQDKFYIFLARTAADATEYFQIPTGRVVEIGTQITV